MRVKYGKDFLDHSHYKRKKLNVGFPKRDNIISAIAPVRTGGVPP